MQANFDSEKFSPPPERYLPLKKKISKHFEPNQINKSKRKIK